MILTDQFERALQFTPLVIPEGANLAILTGMGILLLIVVSLALYFSKDVEGDSVNYIVAGRTLPIPLVGATLMAQSVDANMTIGNTDLAVNFGFWAGAVLPIGLAMALFFTGLFFAKPLNRLHLLTIPDFYAIKYGRSVEILAAIFTSLAFMVLLAGNIVAIAFLFQRFLGVNFTVGAFIFTAIMLIYAFVGGLTSVSRVDIIQVTTVIAGIFALTFYVWWTYGFSIPTGMGPLGFDQMYDPAKGAWINWASIFALGLGDIVALDFMERVFAAESPETAQKGCFAASMGTLIVGIPFAMIAVSTPAILESLGIETGRVAILYVLLEEAVPVWIAALVLAGIFAASLSTGVGAILATSSVFARNLAGLEVKEESENVDLEDVEQDQRSIAQRMDFDLLLLATRIFFVLVAFGGVFIALRVPATGALLVLAFDLMFATVLVPLVFGIYWPNFANKPAALISIVSGATARIVFFVLIPTIYGVENTLLYIPNDILTADWDGLVTILSGAVSLVTFVVVGYVTRETHEPQYLDRDPWGAD